MRQAVDHLIVVDGEAGDGVTALSDVEGSNPDFDADAAVRGGRAD